MHLGQDAPFGALERREHNAVPLKSFLRRRLKSAARFKEGATRGRPTGIKTIFFHKQLTKFVVNRKPGTIAMETREKIFGFFLFL